MPIFRLLSLILTYFLSYIIFLYSFINIRVNCSLLSRSDIQSISEMTSLIENAFNSNQSKDSSWKTVSQQIIYFVPKNLGTRKGQSQLPASPAHHRWFPPTPPTTTSTTRRPINHIMFFPKRPEPIALSETQPALGYASKINEKTDYYHEPVNHHYQTNNYKTNNYDNRRPYVPPHPPPAPKVIYVQAPAPAPVYIQENKKKEKWLLLLIPIIIIPILQLFLFFFLMQNNNINITLNYPFPGRRRRRRRRELSALGDDCSPLIDEETVKLFSEQLSQAIHRFDV